jgi:soluble lytic murein transglycosylase-like protein
VRDWWHWGLGFLAGAAVASWLTLSCAAGSAQTEEVAGAIEYGISLGLPRAWAYRVAWCESRYQPGAYNRWSAASGLYQFLPSTFAATPQGRAGLSVFDPYANAAAAAWLYQRAGGRPWSCR